MYIYIYTERERYHLSNTTCLTFVFFTSGEYCSKVDEPY